MIFSLRILLSLFILLLPKLLFSQRIPGIEWQKCLGGSSLDNAYSIIQTTDGGYTVAGSTTCNDDGDVSANHGGSDIWIVKLNFSGSIEWQRCLGGTSDEYASSIVQTKDGGFVIAGITNSDNGDVSGFHAGDRQ